MDRIEVHLVRGAQVAQIYPGFESRVEGKAGVSRFTDSLPTVGNVGDPGRPGLPGLPAHAQFSRSNSKIHLELGQGSITIRNVDQQI